MANSLEGVLANIPGLGGYLASQRFSQQQEGGQLAQMGALQQLLQGPLKEQLLRAQIVEHQQAPELKRANLENTKQTALARLQQAAAQNDNMMQFRMTQAKTKAEQDAIQNAHRQLANRIAAERLKYDTGAVVDVLPLPAMPAQAPAQGQPVPAAGPVAPQGALPSFQEAMGAMAGRVNAPFTMPVDPNSAQPVNTPAPQVQPAPAPGAAPQTAPQAAPPAPVMPTFAGSPREQATARNKWLTDQAAAGNFSNREVVRQVTKGLEDNFTRLRDAPTALANIEKAKELIPSSNLFQGSLGEQKLAVAKFFNNNLGTSINLTGVQSAEELRSRIFFNIMDNLKKMDAQPSQLQQQIMQDALGKLGTDPSALANILDAFGDTIRDKIAGYDTQVSEAAKIGVNWPHKITIPPKKSGAGTIREFATEAEAAAAGLAPGTRVKIGGKLGTWR